MRLPVPSFALIIKNCPLLPRPLHLLPSSITFYLLDETLPSALFDPLADFLVNLSRLCLGLGEIPHHIAAFPKIRILRPVGSVRDQEIFVCLQPYAKWPGFQSIHPVMVALALPNQLCVMSAPPYCFVAEDDATGVRVSIDQNWGGSLEMGCKRYWSPWQTFEIQQVEALLICRGLFKLEEEW